MNSLQNILLAQAPQIGDSLSSVISMWIALTMLFVTIISLIISQFKSGKNQAKTQQIITDKVLANEKAIKTNHDSFKLEIEGLKNAKSKMYEQMEKIKTNHSTDVNEIYDVIDAKFDRVGLKLETNQKEILNELKVVSSKLTEVCTQVKDHKEEHQNEKRSKG